MCWNYPVSIGLALAGSAAAYTQWKWKRSTGRIVFFTYWALIEVLQALQYTVIDQCDNPVNKALTWLAFLHICFQPLVVNVYLFSMHDDPGTKSLILRLCVAAGVGMANRLPGSPLRALGKYLNPDWADKAPGSGFDWAAAPWPDFPPPAAAGSGELCALDALCGPRLCSIMGSRHVSWSVPLLPTTYVIPSGYMHFFLFFIPAIVTPGRDAAGRRFFAAVGFLTGPLLSMALSRGKAYAFEWSSIWCTFSVAQSLCLIVYEVRNRAAARAKRAAAAMRAASGEIYISQAEPKSSKVE